MVTAVLALVPFVSVVWLVARHQVDVLCFDEWSLVPLVKKSFEGTLSFGDFFAQYGEQRPALLKALLLPIIRWSGWNVSYELALTLLLAAGLFAVFAAQIRATLNSLKERPPFWLLPGVSLLVFSLRQQAVWMVGFYSVFFLNVLPAVAGLFLLSRPGLTRARFLGALLLGLAATFSLASGLLVWPIGLALLAARPFPDGKERRSYLKGLALLGLAVVTVYAWSYHKPPPHPPLGFAAEHPLPFLKYLLGGLGSPVLITPGSGWISGLAGAAGFFAAVWALGRSRRVDLPTLLPWIAVGAYSLGAAVLIAVGRAGFGYAQALAGRYVTLVAPFWVSVLVLLSLVVRESPPGRRVGAVAVAAILFSAAFGSASQASFFPQWNRNAFRFRAELFSMKDDRLLRRYYPNVEVLKKRAEVLRGMGLSVFREGRVGG